MTLLAGSERHDLEGHCRDLSEAGIGILIAADLTMSEVVSLRFSLPTQTESWVLRAVLRYRRGYHYGFEFLSIAPAQIEILKGYLTTLKRADSD